MLIISCSLPDVNPREKASDSLFRDEPSGDEDTTTFSTVAQKPSKDSIKSRPDQWPFAQHQGWLHPTWMVSIAVSHVKRHSLKNEAEAHHHDMSLLPEKAKAISHAQKLVMRASAAQK